MKQKIIVFIMLSGTLLAIAVSEHVPQRLAAGFGVSAQANR